MIDDTLEVDEDSELEEEADEEVDKVLYELTDGKLGQAGTIQDTLPVRLSDPSKLAFTFTDTLSFGAQAAPQEEDVNTEAEMQRMQRELQDLLTG